jgi:hypothetical protein
MRDVDDFIADLTGSEKLIVRRLRSLILETGPRLQEKLSYGVPYYSHHRRICFLWPSSCIPCSESRPEPVHGEVTLGLCYGNLLSNVQGLLLKEDRKQVFLVKFSALDQIDEHAIREIIQEAVLADEEFKKNNKKR